MTAQEKLKSRNDKGYHICVGLDTDIKKIPQHLLTLEDPVFEFNKALIENTKGTAASYKLNLAFYESEGVAGFSALEKTMELIPDDILVIGDAKRGDIGNTSRMYAKAMFDEFKFDSTTLHPYMGFDSIEPFLEYEDKINFVLALTSNSSSADFEKKKLSNGKYLFQEVISKCSYWNQNKNVGIVFGATNSDELKENVESFEELVVLLPGVGAQGGSLEDVVLTFSKANKNSYLINVSRALIYAGSDENFGEAAKKKLDEYNEIIKGLK